MKREKTKARRASKKRIKAPNFFERKIIRNIKEIERDWNFIKNE